MLSLFRPIDPLTDAIDFAVRAHDGRTDLGGELYALHILRVLLRVQVDPLIPEKCRTTAMMAAVLHDAMEDCGVSFRTLRRRFGQDVAVLVLALTRPKSRMVPYGDYIAQVAKCRVAARIKVADLSDNLDARRTRLLESRGMASDARMRRYREAMEVLGEA